MDSKRVRALAFSVITVLALVPQRAAADHSFLDDFSDRDVSDWGSAEGVVLDASSGQLVVTSAPPNASAWPLASALDADVSIRTRVRLTEGELDSGPAEGVGVFARFSNGMGYVALIAPGGELAIALARTGLPTHDVVLASMATTLDVSSSDIDLQFDLFGDALSLTAWAAGTPRPAMPQLAVMDATHRLAGSSGLVGPRTAPSRTAFGVFRTGPLRPVNLDDTTRRGVGIHVVANDCASPAFTRVAPELTDPNIDNFDGGGRDHHVYYNAHAPERDELHVFLPGTDAGPGYGREFMRQAASHGTKTIGLQYVNGPNNDNALCWASGAGNPRADPDCMEKVLAERTYGDDRSPLVSVNHPNSLVSRLVKMLEHLAAEQPERDWARYLDGGAPDWGRIVLSGHSQGASISALVARDHELMRAVMLGGPYEWASGPAAFLTDPKVTPMERHFGFNHVDDDSFLRRSIWNAMGLPGPPVLVENSSRPYEASHYLETDIDFQNAHNSVISNALREPDGTPVFKDVWLHMLGIEALAPCGGEAVYASDPAADVVEIPGGATLAFDRLNDLATITIPGSAWAQIAAEGLGGCSVAGSDGLLCESVSDYTVVIDLKDNLAVPAQDYWTAQLIAGGSALHLTARESGVDTDGFFYQEVAGRTVAVACSTASTVPAGECLPTDLRPPEAYDPITGTFTYLGVLDAFASQAYGLSRFAIEELPVLPTRIDIRPRSERNSVCPFSHVLIPVAILGSDTFDVADVDVTTLAFGSNGAPPAFDLTTFWMARTAYRDVNGDGRTDLRAYFRTDGTGISPGDLETCLTGRTADGTHFKGCDDITTRRFCGRAALRGARGWGRGQRADRWQRGRAAGP